MWQSVRQKSLHKCIQTTTQMYTNYNTTLHAEHTLGTLREYTIQYTDITQRALREYAENTPRTLREPSNHVRRRAIACFTQKGRIHRHRGFSCIAYCSWPSSVGLVFPYLSFVSTIDWMWQYGDPLPCNQRIDKKLEICDQYKISGWREYKKREGKNK